ncbi:MAG TPA: hypothetical protein VNN76_07085 [Bacteroidota bacterium]|nr:hypothetical protein [Bacteroidota bacterium]
MRTLKNLMRLFLLLFCVSPSSLSQDTLKIFRFPPIDQVDVIVKVGITAVQGALRYEYEIKSLPTSKQSIWAIDIPFNILPARVQSPEGWFAIVGGRTPAIGWGADDSLHYIHPNQTQPLFSYDSKGIPSITTIYIRGWAEPPELTFEPDSVVGEDVLEASKKVLTIAAARPPTPFIHLAFLDTLLSYTRQSVQLGWLKSTRDDDCDEDEQPHDGVAKNIEKRIEKAKKELTKGDSVKSRKELEKLVKKVEKIYKKSEEADKKKHDSNIVMTSEAYALLKYNAEYLIYRLPDRSLKRRAREKD